NAEHSFTCASLGSSKYTMDGENISGPAKKPLKSYEAALTNGNLVIRL
ncbi:MAG: hypothetical protein HOB38_29785, partial [Deltaproteobacteria bacterium]|nr:hypothetical protein [Deltaproteobacteria bacterium]